MCSLHHSRGRQTTKLNVIPGMKSREWMHAKGGDTAKNNIANCG